MNDNWKRHIGWILYVGIAQWLPVSYSPIKIGQKKIRETCARMMIASCGQGVNIERKAHFSSKLRIGNRSGVGINSQLSGTVILGDDVMMGPECTIYARNHEFSDCTVPMDRQGFQEERPVVIGDDVWIGGHVIILPGVHIGSHSVIGAGAVVTKDVPQWAVVGGNPAVIKKYRNSTP